MAKRSQGKSTRTKAASPASTRLIDADVIARALVGLSEGEDPQLTSEQLQDPIGLLLSNQYAEFVRGSSGASQGDTVQRQLEALTQRVVLIEERLKTLKPR